MSAHSEPTLVLVGWDYRQTPVELRERLAFSPDKVREALAALRQEGLLAEGAILSTCNRSEVYGLTGSGLAGRDPVRALTEFIAHFHGVPLSDLEGAGYRLVARDAVCHLLRVTAGLESLALGEDQIIGQVREAYRLASGAGATRAVLHRLFQKALEAGKRVRSETGLSSRPISIPGVAIELAQKIFDDLGSRKYLILGAGETSSIFYDLLVARGARQIEVANRTLSKAEELCRRGGSAVSLERLDERLPQADVVISALSVPTPFLTLDMARRAMDQRRGQPLFFLDLGIPRNVDPGVAELDNAFLYAVDDLQEIAERNRQERQNEIGPAMAILDAEIENFIAWFGSLAVVPTLTALRQKFEAVRAEEFDQRLNQLGHLSEEDREKIRLMAQSMVRSLLRGPTEAIKDEPDPGRRLDRAEVARHLFGLELRGE